MIKLTNILLESDDNFLSELQLRRVLSIIDKSQPRLKIELKNYLRKSKNIIFEDSNVYRTISNFLKKNLDITNSYIVKQISLTYLINPNVVDFIKDKIFLPTDMYLTIVEYTEEDYEVTDQTDWVDCPECEGWGTEECYDCDGSGKDESCDECDGSGVIEDPYGEEGDTLVCDECNGSGKMDCYRCDGEGNYDCSYCDGAGEIEEEYEKYELTTITDYYISYVKLPEKIRNIMDGNRFSFDINYFYEWDDTFILWRRNYTSQESKDGTDDIYDDPNELLNYPESVKITDKDVRYFL
jgi:hypothetical protein